MLTGNLSTARRTGAMFAGLLLALPASAVLLVALRKLRDRYLESDVYTGQR